jgi:hypothetical protein
MMKVLKYHKLFKNLFIANHQKIKCLEFDGEAMFLIPIDQNKI